MPYANNKDADQHVNPSSLIIVFVVRRLDSKMSINVISKIPTLWLASIAEQADFSLTCSQNPKYRFSHDVAHTMNQL